MKRLFAAILSSILVVAASAQQQEQQWRAYVYPDDGFGITLPAPTIPHDDVGDHHIHVACSLTAREHPPSVRRHGRRHKADDAAIGATGEPVKVWGPINPEASTDKRPKEV